MKKITITNGYTWYNKGDAGILLGTVNVLKEIFGTDIEINILSFTPNDDKIRYCKDETIKNMFSNVLNPYPFKKTFIRKNLAILKLFLDMAINFIGINILKDKFIFKKDNIKILKESDLIVVCGGGFLGGKKFNSFMHLYQMYVNEEMNKPIVLLGTSVEPIKNRFVKYYTEKRIKKLNHIFPRETITNEYLKHFISQDKITLIPDMAFMVDDKVQKFSFVEDLRKKYDNIFGLTVRKWHFPNSQEPKLANENYINSIVNMIQEYAEIMNAVFVFIPQVIFEGDDDSLIAYEIKNRLNYKYKNNFVIRKDDWSPIEIKALINEFDLFIGTRMHSNIFATSMAVPTVAIAYEKKTNGIMETVGLSDYVIEIDTITSNELIEKVNECYKNKERIHNQLEDRIIDIRRNIIDKSKFIKEL